MHLLHQALDEDKELQQIVGSLSERIAKNPLKHAIVLDLNPFWLACYRLSEAGLREDTLFYRFPESLVYAMSGLSGGGGYIDLSREFSTSSQLTEEFFRARLASSPYLLRIFARPILERNGELVEYRQRLVEAARDTPIATIVETQEPAQLLAGSGDRIISASSAYGTLGGFLRDNKSNKTFAVTCGHVISAGAASTTTGYLGPCVHAAVPIPLPSGIPCTSTCGCLTELDVALIDVGGAAVVNVATSIAAILVPKDIVTMKGAKSGRPRRYEVGGAMVEHTIGGSCWSRLSLFQAPVSVGVLPVAVKVGMTPPPDDGDSGAWLVRGGNEWAGMVVAGDALHGFALAGSAIIAQSDRSFGTQLQLA
ncbi:hypothetical protein [Bradyrhizobium sp.]